MPGKKKDEVDELDNLHSDAPYMHLGEKSHKKRA